MHKGIQLCTALELAAEMPILRDFGQPLGGCCWLFAGVHRGTVQQHLQRSSVDGFFGAIALRLEAIALRKKERKRRGRKV